MLQIRLITFDALHTIISPRHPIHVQYSQVFAPFLGVLPPESIKSSFTKALKEVQTEHPSYRKGAEQWWSDVIRRTAIGAGGSKHGMAGSYGISDDSLIGQRIQHWMKIYRRLLKRLWRVLAQKKVIKHLTMLFLQFGTSMTEVFERQL